MSNACRAPLVDEGRTEGRGHVGRLHASIVAAMRVEIVSDVVCPWCYIGKRRFDRAVTTLLNEGVTLDLSVSYRAYQLDPTAPVDEPEPVIEAYARKFGGTTRAESIIASVTATAAEEGIEFRMDRALRANTMQAHRLLKLVARDRPDLEAAVNESVMQAYFTDGLDIGDPAVLTACAARAGFVADTHRSTIADHADHADDELTRLVRDDLAWAAERDITAVPTFVFNDGFAVPGAQDSTTFVRLLRKMATA